MLDELIVSEQHRQEMLAHVQCWFPEEACGIGGGRCGKVEYIFPITNELHSPVAFRMEPHEQLQAMLWLEEREMDITVIFHSHPAGPPVPSPTDVDQFVYPGTATMIWTFRAGEWRARGFMIDGQSVREIPVRWTGPDGLDDEADAIARE